jgi:hypothetical protein
MITPNGKVNHPTIFLLILEMCSALRASLSKLITKDESISVWFFSRKKSGGTFLAFVKGHRISTTFLQVLAIRSPIFS